MSTESHTGSCIHEFHDDEIPTCPMCGVRTEPNEYASPEAEEHTCPNPNCGYEFVVEYVSEEEDDECLR